MNKTKFQPSESFIIGIILAVSGGFWDAYTYILRGQVFANAETGNIVLLGINIAEGNFRQALSYLIPILAFACGVIITGFIRSRFKQISAFHWRNIVITIEIVIIFSVGFIPQSLNHLVNVLVSFVCAMQVATFKKVWGCACSTTMCTGNLRSGTEQLFAYFTTKNNESLRKSFVYFSVILFFIVGAIIGVFCSSAFGICSIWITCAILFLAYPTMRKNLLHRLKFKIKYNFIRLTRRTSE